MNDGKPVPGTIGNGFQDVRAVKQELQYLGSPPGPIHRFELGNKLVPGGSWVQLRRPAPPSGPRISDCWEGFNFREDAAEEKRALGLRIEAVVVLRWCGKWDLCSQQQGSGQ